ncbi:hypothetical protein Hsar01_00336 [Haloferula sargassicola]|uniref:DUF393 domain-containing protein n=2 Tax=Haloferula sargassicola TaxID=490096 RepID=A0ABP9UP89_9BACT
MLWDGDCGFCGRWIRRWKKLTGEAVAYHPYQEVVHEFPQLTAEQCSQAVQLVMPDGRVLSAAHAVLQGLACGGRAGWLLACYRRSRVFRAVAEAGYRFVAANRSWQPG